jgi:membrane-associated phospholipid phosphatase
MWAKQVLYEWNGANLWLFHVVNDLRGPILDRVMLAGTQIGTHTLFPVYLTVIVLAATFSANLRGGARRMQRETSALNWLQILSVLCVASVLDGAFLTWAKHWFDYPRPLLALPPGTVHVVGEAEYQLSLPSGHASFAMLISASLWPLLSRGWRLLAILFVLWVGISRVNVGAHFPADVLASWLTALLAVLVAHTLIRWCLAFSEPARWRGPDLRDED